MSGQGDILYMDRFPRDEILQKAKHYSQQYDTKLLICFGGNGRSNGYSQMVSNKQSRSNFLSQLNDLIDKYTLDGVDYNWEYPGYSFQTGYQSNEIVRREYDNYQILLQETYEMFKNKNKIITLAYYPDIKQEQELQRIKAFHYAQYLHIMSYDQGGDHHSMLEFAKKVALQAKKYFPSSQITLGLPFYGRQTQTGEWISYNDILKEKKQIDPNLNVVSTSKGSYSFNGYTMIKQKSKFSIEEGLGGVMIWEIGQDCKFLEENPKENTCPDGKNSSLSYAIYEAINESIINENKQNSEQINVNNRQEEL